MKMEDSEEKIDQVDAIIKELISSLIDNVQEAEENDNCSIALAEIREIQNEDLPNKSFCSKIKVCQTTNPIPPDCSREVADNNDTVVTRNNLANHEDKIHTKKELTVERKKELQNISITIDEQMNKMEEMLSKKGKEKNKEQGKLEMGENDVGINARAMQEVSCEKETSSYKEITVQETANQHFALSVVDNETSKNMSMLQPDVIQLLPGIIKELSNITNQLQSSCKQRPILPKNELSSKGIVCKYIDDHDLVDSSHTPNALETASNAFPFAVQRNTPNTLGTLANAAPFTVQGNIPDSLRTAANTVPFTVQRNTPNLLGTPANAVPFTVQRNTSSTLETQPNAVPFTVQGNTPNVQGMPTTAMPLTAQNKPELQSVCKERPLLLHQSINSQQSVYQLGNPSKTEKGKISPHAKTSSKKLPLPRNPYEFVEPITSPTSSYNLMQPVMFNDPVSCHLRQLHQMVPSHRPLISPDSYPGPTSFIVNRNQPVGRFPVSSGTAPKSPVNLPFEHKVPFFTPDLSQRYKLMSTMPASPVHRTTIQPPSQPVNSLPQIQTLSTFLSSTKKPCKQTLVKQISHKETQTDKQNSLIESSNTEAEEWQTESDIDTVFSDCPDLNIEATFLKKHLNFYNKDMIFWKHKLKESMDAPPTVLQFQDITDCIKINKKWYYRVKWCKYTWERGDSLEKSELNHALLDFKDNSKAYKYIVDLEKLQNLEKTKLPRKSNQVSKRKGKKKSVQKRNLRSSSKRSKGKGNPSSSPSCVIAPTTSNKRKSFSKDDKNDNSKKTNDTNLILSRVVISSPADATTTTQQKPADVKKFSKNSKLNDISKSSSELNVLSSPTLITSPVACTTYTTQIKSIDANQASTTATKIQKKIPGTCSEEDSENDTIFIPSPSYLNKSPNMETSHLIASNFIASAIHVQQHPAVSAENSDEAVMVSPKSSKIEYVKLQNREEAQLSQLNIHTTKSGKLETAAKLSTIEEIGEDQNTAAAKSLLALSSPPSSNNELGVCFEIESRKKRKLDDTEDKPQPIIDQPSSSSSTDQIHEPLHKKVITEQAVVTMDPYFNHVKFDGNLTLTPILMAMEKEKKGQNVSFKEFDFAGTIAKSKVPRTIAQQQEKDYICQHCNQSFSGSLSFTKHSHLFSKCKCPQCGLRICNKKNLLKHIKEHAKAAYQCPDCLKAFPSKRLYVKHKKRNHIKKTQDTLNTDNNIPLRLKQNWRECTTCKKRFKTFWSFLKHRKRYCKDTLLQRSGTYHCSICSKSFHQSSCFELHVKCHESITAVVSNKSRRDPLQLFGEERSEVTSKAKCWKNSLHKKAITATKKSYCIECLRGFKNRDAFYQHINVKTCPFLRNNGQCMLCKKFFRSLDNLKLHVTNCFKESLTSLLKPQSRSNSTSEDYTNKTRAVYHCTRCNTMFASLFAFQKHKMLFHSKQLMYKCSSCKFKCRSRNLFKKHVKKKLCPKVDSFPCFCCDQLKQSYASFGSLNHLYRHLKTHKISSEKKARKVTNPHVDPAELTTIDGKKKKLLTFSSADIEKLKGKSGLCNIQGFGTYKVACKPIEGCYSIIVCKTISIGVTQILPLALTTDQPLVTTETTTPPELNGRNSITGVTNKRNNNYNNVRIKCFTCGADFASSSLLLDHFRSLHKYRFVQVRICKLCSIAFKDEESFNIHVKHDHHTSTSSPPSENTALASIESLRKEVTPPAFYVCFQCDLPFFRTEDLKKHEVDMHNMDLLHLAKKTYPPLYTVKWPCCFCNKEFKDIFSHAAKHSSTLLECHICNVKMTNKLPLGRHFQSAHSLEWTQDDDIWLEEVLFYDVEETFRQMYRRRKIKENKCSQQKKKHQCEKCQMVYYHRKVLERHLGICNATAKGGNKLIPSFLSTPEIANEKSQEDHVKVDKTNQRIPSSSSAKKDNPESTSESCKEISKIPAKQYDANPSISKPVNNAKLDEGTSQVIASNQSENKIDPSAPRKCLLCLAFFSNQEQFVKHVEETHEVLPMFVNALALEIESIDQSSEETTSHTCDVCNLQFPDEYALWQDKMAHVGVEVENCPLCVKTFTNEFALFMHCYSDHRSFICFICRKGLHSLKALENHCQLHVHEVNILRDKKGRLIIEMQDKPRGVTKRTLFSNETTTMNTPAFIISNKLSKAILQDCKLFYCHLCGKNIEGELTFIVHVKTHSSNRHQVCFICKKKFSEYSDLYEHMIQHGSDFKSNHDNDKSELQHNKKGTYVCLKCSEVFESDKLLKGHKRKHYLSVEDADLFAGHDMMKIVARYVNKKQNITFRHPHGIPGKDWELAKRLGFSRIYDFARSNFHLKPHVIDTNLMANLEPSVCPYCFIFPKKNYELHMKKHLFNPLIGMKCAFCEYRSKQRADLVAHVQNGHFNKPAVARSLKETTMYCKYCNIETVTTHIQAHYNGLPWKTKKIRCSFCQLVFPSIDIFTKHLKNNAESTVANPKKSKTKKGRKKKSRVENPSDEENSERMSLELPSTTSSTVSSNNLVSSNDTKIPNDHSGESATNVDGTTQFLATTPKSSKEKTSVQTEEDSVAKTPASSAPVSMSERQKTIGIFLYEALIAETTAPVCKLCDWEFSAFGEFKVHVFKHAILPNPDQQNIERYISCHLCGDVVRRTSMKTHITVKHYKELMNHKRELVGKKKKKKPTVMTTIENEDDSSEESSSEESCDEWEVLEQPAETNKKPTKTDQEDELTKTDHKDVVSGSGNKSKSSDKKLKIVDEKLKSNDEKLKDVNEKLKSIGKKLTSNKIMKVSDKKLKKGNKKQAKTKLTQKNTKEKEMIKTLNSTKGKALKGKKRKPSPKTSPSVPPSKKQPKLKQLQSKQPGPSTQPDLLSGPDPSIQQLSLTPQSLSISQISNIQVETIHQEKTAKKRKTYVMTALPPAPAMPYPFTCMVCSRGYFTRGPYLSHFKLSHPWLYEAEREKFSKKSKVSKTKDIETVKVDTISESKNRESTSKEADFCIKNADSGVKHTNSDTNNENSDATNLDHGVKNTDSGSTNNEIGTNDKDSEETVVSRIADTKPGLVETDNECELPLESHPKENSTMSSSLSIEEGPSSSNSNSSNNDNNKDKNNNNKKDINPTEDSLPSDKGNDEIKSKVETLLAQKERNTKSKSVGKQRKMIRPGLPPCAFTGKTSDTFVKSPENKSSDSMDDERQYFDQDTSIGDCEISDDEKDIEMEIVNFQPEDDDNTTDKVGNQSKSVSIELEINQKPILAATTKHAELVVEQGAITNEKQIEVDEKDEIKPTLSESLICKSLEVDQTRPVGSKEQSALGKLGGNNHTQSVQSEIMSYKKDTTVSVSKDNGIEPASKKSEMKSNEENVDSVLVGEKSNNDKANLVTQKETKALVRTDINDTKKVQDNNSTDSKSSDEESDDTDDVIEETEEEIIESSSDDNMAKTDTQVKSAKNVTVNPPISSNKKRSVVAVNTFSCKECSAMFYTKDDLTEHLLVHKASPKTVVTSSTNDALSSSVTAYPCGHCDALFYTEADLKQHRQLHNDKPMKEKTNTAPTYPCGKCNALFYSEVDLSNHIPLHEKTSKGGHFKIKYPFVCLFCGIGFYSRSPLKTHLVAKHSNCYTTELEKSMCFVNLDYEGGGNTETELPKRNRSKFEEIMKSVKGPARKSVAEASSAQFSSTPSTSTDESSSPVKREPKSVTERRLSGRKRSLDERVMNVLKPKKSKISQKPSSLKLKIATTKVSQHKKCENPNQTEASKEQEKNSSSSSEEEEEDSDGGKKEFKYTCKYCDQLFSDKEHMNKHIQRHMKGSELNKLTCVACFCLVSRHELKWHMHTTHEDLRLSQKKKFCAHCNFSSKKGLEKHILEVHPSLLKIECRICDARFSTTSSYNKHFQMTHGKSLDEESLMCLFCNKKFQSLTKLYCHFSIIHMKKNKNLYCALCTKYFYGRTDLKNHQDEFHQNDKYQCGLCLVDFESVSWCEKHVLIHKNPTEHQCKICKFYFESNEHLSKHFMTHEDIFKCEVCDRCFKNVTEYQSHKEIYKCNSSTQVYCVLCDQSFQSDDDLVEHTKRHSMRKTYQCSSCDKSFKTSNEVEEHMELVHQGGSGRSQASGTDQEHVEASVYETDAEGDERLLAYGSSNQCEKCGETFVRHEIYLEHIMKHEQ